LLLLLSTSLFLCSEQLLDDERLNGDRLSEEQGGCGDGDDACASGQDQATGDGEGEAGGVDERFRRRGAEGGVDEEAASQSENDKALKGEMQFGAGSFLGDGQENCSTVKQRNSGYVAA
jgi:hypothetical protein